ncbi:hypothetical protein V1514DRAFT_329959 [Lipomyces japonicus]|uniref:uncharacterized protein n=1 Tax=Lipomyces japonicus TaxID=56871 RepID=UPI0034CDC385
MSSPNALNGGLPEFRPVAIEQDDRPPSRASSVSSTTSHDRGRSRFVNGRVRRDSIASESSLFGEMAHDRPYDGPSPDAIPSAMSSFPHRVRSRSRSTSTARSFRFFNTDEVEHAHLVDQQQQQQQQMHAYDDDAHLNDEGNYVDLHPLEPNDELHSLHSVVSNGTHRRRYSVGHLSTHNKHLVDSTHRPLLDAYEHHYDDFDGSFRTPDVFEQTLYVKNDDMILAMAGYRLNKLRYVVYIILSVLTGGIAYLVLRWLPRWRIAFKGKRAPLSSCDFVVLENQYAQLSEHGVIKTNFNAPLSNLFTTHRKLDGGDDTEVSEYDPIVKTMQYFDYRYMRLILNPIDGKFELNNDWRDASWVNMADIKGGLSNQAVEERQTIFGENSINILEKSITEQVVDEILHPFYIFQIFSMILWSLDEYYFYATCIFIISTYGIFTSVRETRSNLRRLKELSKVESHVRVLRDGFWVTLSSTELVPGDVYEISDPSLNSFPGDCLLLLGDAIVNESMLTGESIPVSKYSASQEALYLLQEQDWDRIDSHELSKSFLYAGTKIVRVRKPGDYDGNAESSSSGIRTERSNDDVAVAMVIRTGFNTTKGSLTRSMLFPKPSKFKFYQDSFRYIGFMSAMATVGFVFYTVQFIRLGLAPSLIAFRALDLITIVVPPALPATLKIGTNVALGRLKKKSIYCISPNHVNVGGKLDIFCFDKTGTLTEEGLDVLGVHVADSNHARFSELLQSPEAIVNESIRTEDIEIRKAMLFSMATCHSLRNHEHDLIGDPLDKQMFNFTRWGYEEEDQYYRPHGSAEFSSGIVLSNEVSKLAPAVAHPPASLARLILLLENDSVLNIDAVDLGIVRMFEFVSSLRRSSVVVKRASDPSMVAYVKGAPEAIQLICKPGSYPENYEQLLHEYTHKGYRVIALASKILSRYSWFKAQRLTREEVETDLDFIGFVIFENKVKERTPSVLKELAVAKIKTVMCTGDNALTAVSVARECGLLNLDVPVFSGYVSSENDCLPDWVCVDDENLRLDNRTLTPLITDQLVRKYSPEAIREYSLVVIGDVFKRIVEQGSEELLEKMLTKSKVYARMSPDEKSELVSRLQDIDYSVGFCGDGANDCSALKAADVGISLSEAEASVAAPFTSRVFDISCVPVVIKEGRAALVTSFSCFKYMSLYSAIQFVTVGILYNSGTNLGDFQFLLIDMFLILPIAVFMAESGPYKLLCPKRPTANLVSQKILVKLVGQIFISIFFQISIYILVRHQPWYMPPVAGADDSHVQSSENTALFLASCYQYILIAIVLSIGPPYREALYKNYYFVITIAVTVCMISFVLFEPPQWLFNLLVLTRLSYGFKCVIIFNSVAYFISAWAGEKYVFVLLSEFIKSTRRTLNGGRKKQRKKFKILLEAQEREFSLF